MKRTILTLILLALTGTITINPALAGEHTVRNSAAPGPDATLTVCPDGPPDCDYDVIQDAVDAANPGDVVKVATGTYDELNGNGGHTQVVYVDKSLTLRGGYTAPDFAEPPDPVTNPTTVDAQNAGRAIYVAGGGTADVTISGLRLTGGYTADGAGDNGAGLYADAVQALTLTDNQVFANESGYLGGGIYVNSGSVSITGNTFASNNVFIDGAGVYLFDCTGSFDDNEVIYNFTDLLDGGGLFLRESTVTLHDNVITYNQGRMAGGVYIASDSTVTLEGNAISNNVGTSPSWLAGGLHAEGNVTLVLDGNLFTNNTGGRGGALSFSANDDVTLVNNYIAGNTAAVTGGALYVEGDRNTLRLWHNTIAANNGGGIVLDEALPPHSTIALTNTILVSHTVAITVAAGNTATVESTLWWNNDDDTGGEGLIVTTNDYYGDPDLTPGDYHLGPNSAAIDQGLDAGITVDIEGHPRPLGAGYDLGADERLALDLAKTAVDLDGPPLYEGDVLEYTILVTNAGDVEISGATISDTIPAYTTYVWDSDDPEADVETGSLLAWQDETIPANSTAAYLFQVTVDQGAAGQTIQNTAQLRVGEGITTTPPIEPPGGGEVQPTPGDLSIVKSAEDLDGPPLYEGDVVGYVITVTNPGTTTHTNVAVQDAIPAGTTYVDGSADPPQTSGPDPLVWVLATLNPDESQTFTFQVTVDEGMAGGSIGGNVAAVASDQQIDPRTTPPTWPPGGGQVEPRPEVPPLSVAKVAGDVNGPPLLVGDQVEYHVLLFNAAAVTATEVWIEDYIPANTGYVPGSATTTNGTISGPDPLRVDAAEQLALEMLFFRFRVTVDPVSSITTITNTATAAISGQAPVEAQAIIGPVGGDDVGLVIGKVVADLNGPPLYEGDVLEYTIGLANTDNVTHTHVVVTDAIPYGTSYVEGSAEPPQASGPDPLLWTVEDLPAKEIVFFTFRVTVGEGMAGQSIGGNVAIANSEQQEEPVWTPPVYPPPVSPDDPPGWVSPPGLSLAKSARDVDGPPLYEGDVVRYTITVTNDTTDTIHTDVILQDAVPAGLTYVADSANPPQDEGPNPLVWRLGDLAPGEDATVVFEVTVDEGMAGQMIPGNVAIAVSEQLEEPIVTPPITPPDPEVQPRPSPEPTYVYLPLILKNHEVFRPPTPTPPIGDEYEPDDSCADAKSITPGDSQVRTFDPAGDEDWIELAMTAGQSYAIQTGDLAGGADTILQLYASDCLVLLAENDDYEPDTLWSRIEWTATETASHYLRVRNYDPTIGGEGVGYSISVQQIP